MGAMWMSGKVADRVIELKSDIASMDMSEDQDSKQDVLLERIDHKQLVYEEVQISDSEDESELDSDSFKKGVRKVYIKLKNAEPKYAQTNIKHFVAYIVRRLYAASGDSWHPTKRRTSTVEDFLAKKYQIWFAICIKLAPYHWDEAVRRGNAEYWLNTMKQHLNDDDELIKKLLDDLPMCVSVLNKIGEKVEKIEQKITHPDKKTQKKVKNVPKKTNSKEKSTKKGDDADSSTDTESESERRSNAKGK